MFFLKIGKALPPSATPATKETVEALTHSSRFLDERSDGSGVGQWDGSDGARRDMRFPMAERADKGSLAWTPCDREQDKVYASVPRGSVEDMQSYTGQILGKCQVAHPKLIRTEVPISGARVRAWALAALTSRVHSPVLNGPNKDTK